MSNSLTIEGKEYVPATIAGKHLGYTKDYMLMLIKKGKIDGQKVGNKWFVYLASAEKYFKEAEKAREERRKKLSEERKAELRESGTYHEISKEDLSKPERVVFSAGAKMALLETVVVVFLGVSVGSLGYVGVTAVPASAHSGAGGFFERLALSVYDFFTWESRETKSTPVVAEQINTQDKAVPAVSMQIGTTTRTSLVVAPDELFTATTIESIEESFSDEVRVSVDTENPNTGIIVPKFSDGDGEEYRFMIVPVNQSTE
jgi:hypothetical protein